MPSRVWGVTSVKPLTRSCSPNFGFTSRRPRTRSCVPTVTPISEPTTVISPGCPSTLRRATMKPPPWPMNTMRSSVPSTVSSPPAPSSLPPLARPPPRSNRSIGSGAAAPFSAHHDAGLRPASRSSPWSSETSGFPVVSSFSP
jgi:hypothetical protein